MEMKLDLRNNLNEIGDICFHCLFNSMHIILFRVGSIVISASIVYLLLCILFRVGSIVTCTQPSGGGRKALSWLEGFADICLKCGKVRTKDF